MKNHRNVIKDFWEVFVSFGGALVAAYDSTIRLFQLGWITNDNLKYLGNLIFLVFGCLAILKFIKKARKAEDTVTKLEKRTAEAERQFKELNIAFASQRKELESIRVEYANGSLVAREINNPIINNLFGDDKKKDDEQEMVFPRTFCHDEFFILKDTPEHVLNYIKKDISSTLWFINVRNEFFFDVDYTRTEFGAHGIYFHVVKVNAEQKEGFIQRGNIKNNIPRLFWISITPTGIGEEIRLQIDFETQEKDATDFFNELRKKLVKNFTIWEPKYISIT